MNIEDQIKQEAHDAFWKPILDAWKKDWPQREEYETREEYRRQDWESRHCMDDGYEELRRSDYAQRWRDSR